jgi:hypothetical protein
MKTTFIDTRTGDTLAILEITFVPKLNDSFVFDKKYINSARNEKLRSIYPKSYAEWNIKMIELQESQFIVTEIVQTLKMEPCNHQCELEITVRGHLEKQ